ncbi:hypothetical protein A6R68_23585, partial [Neotoma lepida]
MAAAAAGPATSQRFSPSFSDALIDEDPQAALEDQNLKWYDWYQTESQVIITLMIKNIQKNDVNVEFSEKEIEIKMKKPEAVRWEKLEGQGDEPTPKQFTADVKNLYPSSSHYTRNWDKLVGEIKEEEKNEKLEGDAALNKLFQQIYSDGSDEVKRAMNKSF